MVDKKTSSSGGSGKIGRNRDKCKRYRERKTREYNKLKRILQSNGLKEAKKYAWKHSLQFNE